MNKKIRRIFLSLVFSVMFFVLGSYSNIAFAEDNITSVIGNDEIQSEVDSLYNYINTMKSDIELMNELDPVSYIKTYMEDGKGNLSMSKVGGAVVSLLLKEVKSENIGVCNVYPGGVDTNFRAIPNHNYLKPETIATMIKACIENEEGCVHEIVVRPSIEDNIC